MKVRRGTASILSPLEWRTLAKARTAIELDSGPIWEPNVRSGSRLCKNADVEVCGRSRLANGAEP
jgi:hypothetical protein